MHCNIAIFSLHRADFCGVIRLLVMDNVASGSRSTHDTSLLTQEDTVSLVKNIITS